MSAPTLTPTTYACARCIWAGPYPSEPKGLACRKDTPRIVRGGRMAVWPLVRPDDYCSQFTPRRDQETR